jgi:N utilization substance protein B
MPRVDRTAVRIAVYESDFLDVPDAVAVAEAVALVADLSTDDSPDYVNGLLGKVISTKTGAAG